EWERRCEVAEGELAVIRTAAGSHSEQLDALAHERAQLEAELAHGRTQLEATRERETALAQRVAELEAELDRTRTEDLQLRDGFAHLESLIQTGADASDASAATGVLDLDGAATTNTF